MDKEKRIKELEDLIVNAKKKYYSMTDDIDIEPDAKQSFSLLYGAPSTQEEKQMFNIYKENYERGYREGRRAGRE